MGGGAAMRSAAKVAGVGVVNGGFRGFPSIPQPEQSFTSAARKATRPVAAIFSSSDTKSDAPAASASVERASWEINDWQFAGGKDEFNGDLGEPMPRLVFGGAPTMQEAEEATSELKIALEEVYLSPNSSGGSFISHPEHINLAHSDSVHLENKACVIDDAKAKAPKHAIQAFRLLNESSAAQTVVASIASDQNVWTAVMQNEALVEYLHSQKTNTSFPDTGESSKDSTAGSKISGSPSLECFDDKLGDEKANPGNSSENFFQNLMEKVEDMLSSLSGFFQKIFDGPRAVEERDKTTFADQAMGATFMGLVIMVIMVVALKRS